MSKIYTMEFLLTIPYNLKNIEMVLLRINVNGLKKVFWGNDLNLESESFINTYNAAKFAHQAGNIKKAFELDLENTPYIYGQLSHQVYNNAMRLFFFEYEGQLLLYIDMSGIALKKDFKLNMHDIDFEYYLNILLNALEPFCIKSLSAEGF